MKLKELAERLGCRLVGDPDIEISGVSEIQNARSGDLTFLTNPKYRKFLKTTKASAVLLEKEIPDLKISQLVCSEPYVAFAKALNLFYPEKLPEPGISEKASVSPTAEIAEDCYIGDFAFIGQNVKIGKGVKIFPGVYIGDNCEIGDHTVIFPNVTIYSGTRIGRFVRIHSGTVIGSDGFGYAFSKEEKKIYKVPQTGGVVIEDFVEIGANTTIDRGTIGDTVIGEGTKIDNLVQVGHNVKIGKYCFIVSQVGISGSTRIGDFVTLAGKVGVAGHIEIASNVTVAAKSGITKSIKEPGTYAGFPVRPYREWRKIQALIDRLPEIYEKIRKVLKG
ncbi:UDP-3-O-(3-hydroxymyristoyl)glucosamine N-acyltransferase [Phorcysia thermohydrogeniphila]|uniref:UDP-3-O-acylglucosamine N-acyltransferase n=1 Tax=Phorcysia thermohydrogeniphila TaxID=936138 RepID=A0A4R1GHN5_9BACT|nr:UDP-3-O-(3-hydroxymyristoyl)glucosamine N-acyltransferase [Phorcysia thermohydrogeniphila]TCK06573.1 UDP-3-O-[3-hydroxymyristoyl] glucosamine N-acyltransferase [Phorcysia thermohydrogeniphila]